MEERSTTAMGAQPSGTESAGRPTIGEGMGQRDQFQDVAVEGNTITGYIIAGPFWRTDGR